MTTTREKVFEAIDEEREYQETKWGGVGTHSDIEFLTFIENYVNEAKHVFSRELSPEADIFVSHTMRKIAGLAVACMEQNGVVTRTQEGARPIGASRI